MFAGYEGGETGGLSVIVQSTPGRTLLWTACGSGANGGSRLP